MKIFFLVLILSLPGIAARGVTIKGILLSYTDTHFKIKEGKKVWELPLTVMEGPDRTVIEKKVGKEIEVLAPADQIKKAK